ncbi:hypothetical protein A2382_02385 [Candidatus Woesebacteria bacterium RIFOXYB1_FULL_38_16]|uniref:Uncharacterized protein n=1 Tax=Candidatus Woesebacteria bacterium RIFOXYB1_FULL_38_16 TaxID=1802538 RepID=A0A1F8CTH1_9BACT|nr:MAG: hypothetical protein A2191_04550 [Candidatus Woesebacteria bacterium RIFOXYA1_FULL_38_9]OGM78875.1 MAG: hypothetical protein A2382_02385 [Candidatus Woesebacteria bacterium RIFOXYB1_FULL_38_16]
MKRKLGIALYVLAFFAHLFFVRLFFVTPSEEIGRKGTIIIAGFVTTFTLTNVLLLGVYNNRQDVIKKVKDLLRQTEGYFAVVYQRSIFTLRTEIENQPNKIIVVHILGGKEVLILVQDLDKEPLSYYKGGIPIQREHITSRGKVWVRLTVNKPHTAPSDVYVPALDLKISLFSQELNPFMGYEILGYLA